LSGSSHPKVDDERNELVRKIMQVCARCKFLQKDATCAKKSCHYKRVKQWLKRIKEIDARDGDLQ
jgi:hypothetical protein